MKNRLLLTFLFGAMAAGLTAQTLPEGVTKKNDVTSKITNSDFSSGKTVTSTVYTYDYNLPEEDKGAGAGGTGIFGMQAVDGWTANYPSNNIKVMWTENKDAEGNAVTREDKANAKAAGLFAYSTGNTDGAPGLGGTDHTAPEKGTNTGNLLGYVAVWGADLAYTQDITIPAGDYCFVVSLVNTAGTGTITKNLIGFIAEDGTEYLSTTTSYGLGTSYENDYVIFRLEKETKGKLSLGYQAGNAGSGDMPHIFVDKVYLIEINTDYIDAKNIADARAELEDLIAEGLELGVDVSASQAVLNKANPTLEELKDAITKQKAANTAAQTDMSSYFINNPHFTEDDALPNGEGICTYNYDMEANNVTHWGMLPVKEWTTSHPFDPKAPGKDPNKNGYDGQGRASGVFAAGSTAFLGSAGILPPATMSDGSTTGNLLGFVTCWSMTMQYTQQVTLPAGTYTLVLSYYNSKGANAIAKNLIGFKEDNGTEHYAKTTKFEEGKWLTEKVTFKLDKSTSGTFSMGYTAPNEGSGNQPHFFIDGISIYFVGEMDNPSLMILESAIASAEETMQSKYNKDIKAKLTAAIKVGQDLSDAKSTDEEANTKATEAINALMGDVRASIAAYKNAKTFMDDGALTEAIRKYGDTNVYPELANALFDLEDELEKGYNAETLTTEKIDELTDVAALNAIIKTGVKSAWDKAVKSGEKLDADMDISPLFDQLAYTYSTSAVSGANVPDKEWSYGDATNFKTQYGTAEVWNQSPFTVSRTIKNMPAGTYTITTKAFYRVADNAANYDADLSTEGKAYVFAGGSKTELANVKSIAAATAPEGLGWSEVQASQTVYQPNNQQSAYNTFENAAYTETLQKSASTVVANDGGSITFGITSDQLNDNSWVVWYTFSIAYNAVDQETLNNELAQLVIEAYNFVGENSDYMNQYASGKLATAAMNGEDAEGGDLETVSKAIADIQEALEYAKANIELLNKLEEAKDALDEAHYDYYASASEKSQKAYDDVSEKISEGDDDLTNEEIQALINEIYDVIQALKVPAYDGATDDEPVDMTQVIENPDFEITGKQGWKWNVENITGTGDKNNPSISGSNSTEFWDNTPLDNYFKIAQTLSHLPAGTYELKATAVAAQVIDLPTVDEDDEDAEEIEAGYIALFATPEGGNISSTKVEIRENIPNPNGTNDDQKKWGTDEDIIGDAKEYSLFFVVPEDDSNVEIGFQTVGTQTTKWFVCDDFELWYYGTESENAPTEDEGELTGIDAVNAASAVEAIYTVTGAQTNSLQKGINIVKYANGKVVKVLVK